MTKKRYLFAVIFAAAAIAVIVAFFAASGFFRSTGSSSLAEPNPDNVTVAPLPNGGRIVNDKTGGYSFVLPSRWYLEKKEGSGIAVYPDYVPNGNTPPKCKIEISVFRNIPAAGMNDWATSHLREDPTITVAEKSRAAFSAPGAQSAFEWQGTIDDIATALAYIAANGNVYEVAPSAFDIASADGNTACDGPFRSFLSTINFEKNAK
jgi:hypothetical protein